MGELMRRYWHPIAASEELAQNPFRTKEVRILGEDLVLYRDRRGTLGLVDRACPHRRVNMAYGVVEEDGLRCQYHGWKFDETGRCTEQPFEDTVRPEGRFRDKCAIKAYPAQELAGLIFAYLGPQPAPLLPRWEPLVWENVVRDIAISELPCNWLQCQENSLDPVHVEWLHRYYGDYVRKIQDGANPTFGISESLATVQSHEKIGFDVFEHGIIKRRVLKGFTEEDEDWRVGHPVLFPNILLVGNQFSATLQFRVPADDTHTFHVSLYTFRAAPGTQVPEQDSVPCRMVPLFDEEGKWIVDILFNQDYMAWATQGAVTERHLEKLGESDKGIILFRRQLKQQIEVLRKGGDPMNVFRDPARNGCITLPLEQVKFHVTRRPEGYRPAEAGYSSAAREIEGVQATWDLAIAGD